MGHAAAQPPLPAVVPAPVAPAGGIERSAERPAERPVQQRAQEPGFKEKFQEKMDETKEGLKDFGHKTKELFTPNKDKPQEYERTNAPYYAAAAPTFPSDSAVKHKEVLHEPAQGPAFGGPAQAGMAEAKPG